MHSTCTCSGWPCLVLWIALDEPQHNMRGDKAASTRNKDVFRCVDISRWPIGSVWATTAVSRRHRGTPRSSDAGCKSRSNQTRSQQQHTQRPVVSLPAAWCRACQVEGCRRELRGVDLRSKCVLIHRVLHGLQYPVLLHPADSVAV